VQRKVSTCIRNGNQYQGRKGYVIKARNVYKNVNNGKKGQDVTSMSGTVQSWLGRVYESGTATRRADPVFVNLLRSQGIDSQRGGNEFFKSIPGLLKRLQIRAQER
jgi:hypothetical protein